MTEAEETALGTGEQFLEHMKTLPWCRQGESTLVAVHKGTPEVVEAMRGHEVKVFPGGINVKMNKSLLNTFQEKFDEGQPLPVVVVWKMEGVEIWYRRHKTEQFPYDTWTDPSAAAYERERIFISADLMGADFATLLTETAGRTKECPSMVPQY
jgi:hypothetical protein